MIRQYGLKLKKSITQYGIMATMGKIYHHLYDLALPSPPLNMLVVEITTGCILRCAGCVRTVMVEQSQWKDRNMTIDDFTKLVAMVPKAKLFIPQGIGEPTMHPQFEEIIRIAAMTHKFDKIEINTNGLVRPIEYYGLLFDSGLTYLTVSVDSLNQDIVDKVRSGTDIEKLKHNLAQLSNNYPGRVGIRITVSRTNLNIIPTLLEELNRLGEFHVWLQPFFDMGYNNGVLSFEERQIFLQQISVIAVDLNNLTITPEQFVRSKNVCLSPWKAPAITIDGYLKPCCLILHQESIQFGNLFKDGSFSTLWNSEDFNRCRQDFNHRSPTWCRNCPFYERRV